MSIWFTIPWLFPYCKLKHFVGYLIWIILIYFCNIVKLIFKMPLTSLWLLLGLIAVPFTNGSNLLCVLHLMVYMWPWSIIVYLCFIIYDFTLKIQIKHYYWSGSWCWSMWVFVLLNFISPRRPISPAEFSGEKILMNRVPTKRSLFI